MRVMHMAHMAPPVHNAGAETHTHMLLRALVDAGHEVDVVLSNRLPGGDYEFDGVRVHGRRDKRDPFRFVDKVDAITCHLENTPRATLIGRMQRKPVVHLCHNDLQATRNWLASGYVSLAVFNAQWMADAMADHCHCRSVIVRPVPDAAEYATRPGDRVTLVNLWPDKGGLVFRALAERMPDVDFLGVIGAYGDQVEVGDLPNVEVQPHTPDVRGDVLSRTRVLLMPSAYESWGRIASESMVSGIPVVAHPTPGLLENLGDAGTFVDRDDLDGWVSAVRRLLTQRGWRAASTRAKRRSAEQQAGREAELAGWVAAMESVASRRLVGAR